LNRIRDSSEDEDLRVERAQSGDLEVIAYLEREIVRNSFDIWNFQSGDKRYELFVSRVGGGIRTHLGIYSTPEAVYVSLGGEPSAAESLLPLVPHKAVVTMTSVFRDLITRMLEYDAIYPNDIMVVNRGEERLRSPDLATRLSRESDIEYSTFGSSFNIPAVPMEWVRERLDKDIIFGAFADGNKLASVASLVAWLPQIAVIMGVETKPEFRRRGLGATVVSAAVREALTLSESCSLFVRSDNGAAVSLYSELGFKKVAGDLWIDIGTGLIP
jgi:ribosomal protein S18 acetylase RimI-like enzyme